MGFSQEDTETLGAGIVRFEIQYFYDNGATNIEINGRLFMDDSFSAGTADGTGGVDGSKIYEAEAVTDTTVVSLRGIASIVLTSSVGLVDTYTVTYTDDTTFDYTVTNGEKGETGDTGATGAQGIQGDKGDIGLTGAQGEKGETGEQGIQGEKGDKGDTGATGAAGTDGAQVITATDQATALALSADDPSNFYVWEGVE